MKHLGILIVILFVACDKQPTSYDLNMEHSYPAKLSGKVQIYSSGDYYPFPNATIRVSSLDEDDKTLQTDSQGTFSFSFPAGNETNISSVQVEDFGNELFPSTSEVAINSILYDDIYIDFLFISFDRLNLKANVSEVVAGETFILSWNATSPFGYFIAYTSDSQGWSSAIGTTIAENYRGTSIEVEAPHLTSGSTRTRYFWVMPMYDLSRPNYSGRDMVAISVTTP